MSDQKSNQDISVSSTVAITNTTVSSDVIYPRRHKVQDFLLIWADANIDQSDKDCQNTLAQLRNVVNDVNIFTERDECIDFLTDIEDIKALLLVEATLGKQIMPFISDIPQLDAVYVLCSNKSEYEGWAKEWIKVKGVYTEIVPVCISLQQAVRQYNQDTIAMSFVTVDDEAFNKSLDQLEPSFMYTQIFKEILLHMKYDRQSIKDFTSYCRNADYGSPTNIDRFENEYRAELAIWWYTLSSFIFSMLNYALRKLEAETIIKMGFFINDLHRQIEQLYQQQVGDYHGQPFTVYRGQGLPKVDFEKLLKTKGGLMSFNNFLSTSKEEEVSLDFAKIALTQPDMVGILFKISIDPSVSSAPFVSISSVSAIPAEKEILFSMHTVFRIGEIKQIDNSSSLYQVELRLTADDDQQLRTLTKRIRNEMVGPTEEAQLGVLLIKIGQFDKAEELFKLLLQRTSDEICKAVYYNQLGCVKQERGDYEQALSFCEKSLEILMRFPLSYILLASVYGNIGFIYNNMGEYSKAVSFCRKTLEIYEKTLPSDDYRLATCNNNIGLAYYNMGEYLQALPFYEKTLEIRKKILPPNHPDLATTYNNISRVYGSIGEHSKALCLYEKTLEIRQRTLPPDHPDLAQIYNNIGFAYDNLNEYSKALSFYEKALKIREKTLPPDHPDLAQSYNNIATVYTMMGDLSKALSLHEKALKIREKTLPPDHPDLAQSYGNIAGVYTTMGDLSKAFSFSEKALKIREKSLSSNHPDFAQSYLNTGGMHIFMGEYSKALFFIEKVIAIQQKTLPPNHPELALSYQLIAMIYLQIGESSKANSFFQKAIAIQQKSLDTNDLH